MDPDDIKEKFYENLYNLMKKEVPGCKEKLFDLRD